MQRFQFVRVRVSLVGKPPKVGQFVEWVDKDTVRKARKPTRKNQNIAGFLAIPVPPPKRNQKHVYATIIIPVPNFCAN